MLETDQPVRELERRPYRKALPAGYHLAHFSEMLDFIERVYAHVLDQAECEWINDFQSLNPAAQSLLVRMTNRKGTVFRVCQLQYEDVGDPATSLNELSSAGFTGDLAEADFAAALSTFNKVELFALLAETHADQGLNRNLRKSILETKAHARLDFHECFSSARASEYVALRRREPLRFLLYLYFGRIEESLTRFALRDLGVMRTNGASKFEARFETREDAVDSFDYADQLNGFDPQDARRLALRLRTASPCSEAAMPLRDQLVFEVGRALERQGDTDAAEIYQLSNSPECRERRVRLLCAAGDSGEAQEMLDAMIAAPESDAEALFAADFLGRKFGGKRTSMLTDMLRSAEVIALDDSYRMSPERGAKARFEREGWSVRHAENTPWRALFGLLFWDELFGEKACGRHNEFERLPPALRDGNFWIQKRELIERKLDLLHDHAVSLKTVLKAFAGAYGKPNAVFRWRTNLIDLIKPLIENAPPNALAVIMRDMARNYPERKDGFPDLMLTRGGALKLIEIKTENDVLRRNQLIQLQSLREAGFDVDVNRIHWAYDPDQTYVVVDVETTGGRAEQHRVTEIGAVKVQGTEIIGKWQSLINPLRKIPPMITRLTGISDGMVAEAPTFDRIADEFEEFVGDAVFVAHNVRFDHGFIAAEYGRLERRFRSPQLCTCQSMRAHFKGLPSYGLAKLCNHFEIPLTAHHRALCDAEAAAQLLLLVNEKRALEVEAR